MASKKAATVHSHSRWRPGGLGDVDRFSPVTLRRRLSTGLLLNSENGSLFTASRVITTRRHSSAPWLGPRSRPPAETGMVEPVIVRFGLHIAPRAPVGGREADGVEPPVLHHLQIRVGAVQHAVHPPLENPVRVRPGGVLDVDLDAMPLAQRDDGRGHVRSEEHTSELQSLAYLVCRLLLEKKNVP